MNRSTFQAYDIRWLLFIPFKMVADIRLLGMVLVKLDSCVIRMMPLVKHPMNITFFLLDKSSYFMSLEDNNSSNQTESIILDIALDISSTRCPSSSSILSLSQLKCLFHHLTWVLECPRWSSGHKKSNVLVQCICNIHVDESWVWFYSPCNIVEFRGQQIFIF